MQRAGSGAVAPRDPTTLVGLNHFLESREPVAKACDAVQLCLEANRDNLRGFFEQCFPLLLTKIFGYGCVSWIAAVAQPGKEADAAKVVQLLSPTGKLLAAMQSADADHIIRFILPQEFLPARTQMLLRSELGLKELQTWPQYSGSIVKDPKTGQHQLQVNVFNYYIFWFAFYVLGKHGSTQGPQNRSLNLQGSRTNLNLSDQFWAQGKTWVSQHARPFHRQQPGGGRKPYLSVLQAYLSHFLPQAPMDRTAAAVIPPRGSGVVLLSVLIEFWLTCAEDPAMSSITRQPGQGGGALRPQGPAPLHSPQQAGALQQRSNSAPTAAARAGGGSQQPVSYMSAQRTRAYQLPADDLVDAIRCLVQHLTCRQVPASARQQPSLAAASQPSAEAGAGAPSGVRPAPPGSGLKHQFKQPAMGAPRPAPAGSGGAGGGVVMQPTPSGAWIPQIPLLQSYLPVPPALPGPLLGASVGGRPFQTLMRYVYCFLYRSFAGLPVENMASLRKLLDLWRAAAVPWSAGTAPAAAASAGSGRRASTASAAGAARGGPGAPAAARAGGGQALSQITSSLDDFLNSITAGGGQSSAQVAQARQQPYSSEWRAHVLATLPFTVSLVPLLLDISITRVQYSTQPLEPLKELLMVLKPLADSGELIELLKAVDASLVQFRQGHQRASSQAAYAEALPFISDQAHDWEKAALAGTAALAGGPLAPPVVPLGLFSLQPGSPACNMTLLLRIEKLANVEGGRKMLADLQAVGGKVFPLDEIPLQQSRSPMARGAFGDLSPLSRAGLRKSTWEALAAQNETEKRDIRRPITSNELGFLVRAVLPLHDKFDLDLRCVADVRNLVASCLLLMMGYLCGGSVGASAAAVILGILLAVNRRLDNVQSFLFPSAA